VSVRLLLIDNYDSFTYNLVQAFLVLGADVIVYRNDAISVAEAEALAPTHLVISPGPGRPGDAGVSMEMIRHFAGRVPVLGVCLGHQSIVEAFGGEIVSAAELMHGKTSLIRHDGDGLFQGLPDPCEVGRYHSLAAQRERIPDSLVVTARTQDGEVMGVRHRALAVAGVQFHPESVLTPDGPRLLGNFLYPGAGHPAGEAPPAGRLLTGEHNTGNGSAAGAGNGAGNH
jgi:anthranilate synthase/aminodeoxychorismate synthase-like glutamine amidotransferase